MSNDPNLHADAVAPALRVADALREIAEVIASQPHGDRLVTEASMAVEELVVAEEELRAQAEELAASRDAVDAERERYAGLFEMLPDAVIETDAHGKIVDANDAAGRLLGVPMRSISGKLLVSFVRAEDRRVVRHRLREASGASGESMLRIVDRAGTEHLVAASFAHHVRHDRSSLLWALRDLSYLAEIDRLGATVEELGQLAALQRLVGDTDPLGPLVGRILSGSTIVLPGHVIVIRLDHGAFSASSDVLGERLAAAESELGEGPTLDASTNAIAIEASGVEVGRRWPSLGPRALQLCAYGVCAVPVLVDGEPVGAVAAWRTQPEPAEPVGPFLAMVAEHLAIAHANRVLYRDVVERGVNLERALEFRGVIERAKGMIMHACGVTADEAFVMLRETSQRSNRKLRTVALDVAEGRLAIKALHRSDAAR